MDLQKPREIAARALLRHATGHAYLEDVLDREFAGRRLKAVDRSLIQELCYGVTRWRATLDWLIARQAAQRPPPLAAQMILRLGLYQLLWLDRVPAHAAVNETVEAAHALQIGSVVGFVNAILRNHARTAEETRKELVALRTTDPALGWSHPAWLVDRWKTRLSPEELQTFLEWNNRPAPTYARVNTLKTDGAKVIKAWREEGVEYDFTRWPWVEDNLVFLLRRHPSIDRLRTYRDGCFYIQDPATLFPVSVLAPKPGASVLDLCAAPGGKATYIAQLLDNDGRIVAVEPDRQRRDRLQQNVDRLGADISAVAPDDPDTKGPFDAALVDAPCSNTGVLRRRVEARWRIVPEDFARFQKTQRELLIQGLDRLRPGGRLVYSTCSVEPDENEDLVRAVLAERPDATLVSSRLLHPASDGVDGSFAALILREKAGGT